MNGGHYIQHISNATPQDIGRIRKLYMVYINIHPISNTTPQDIARIRKLYMVYI